RTGIANIIGRQVLRIAGRRETPIVVVIMLTAAFLSMFMNNIGVAALMLPVVMDVSRRARVSPSRLLIPLVFGTLLGGQTTLFGTSHNLIVSEALRTAGYEPFSVFDFIPVGGGIVITGVLFMALVGRLMLPRHTRVERGRYRSQRSLRSRYKLAGQTVIAREPVGSLLGSQASLRSRYKLAEQTFMLRVPVDSVLVGKTLAQSRIGAATGLIILALIRFGRSETLPSRQTVLRAGDSLLVQGRLDQFRELQRWSDLVIEREAPVLKSMVASRVGYAEVTLAEGSPLVGELIREAGFRNRFNVSVAGIWRRDHYRFTNLAFVPLRAGDRILVQGEKATLEELHKFSDFSQVVLKDENDLSAEYKRDERMFVVRLPKYSDLAEVTLAKSRLADVFDFRVIAIFRDGKLNVMPKSDEVLLGGDLRLIKGQHEDLDVLRGLEELVIETHASRNLGVFDSERLTLMGATLAPRSRSAGRTVGEHNIRERYGIDLAGIWR